MRYSLIQLFKKYQFDQVIHLAAESHVIDLYKDPLAFVKTNVIGTMILLNAFKTYWKNNLKANVFYHISTDEVYGTLGETGLFTETQLMIQTRLIQLQKQVQIILLELMEKPMDYLM